MDLLTSLTARWTGFMTILIVVMSMRCWPMSFTSVASSAQVCREVLGQPTSRMYWEEDDITYLYESITKLPELALIADTRIFELDLL